jgi:hypothetical protein
VLRPHKIWEVQEGLVQVRLSAIAEEGPIPGAAELQQKAQQSWTPEVQALLQLLVLPEEGAYQHLDQMYRGPKGLINPNLLLYKAGNIHQVIPNQGV